MIEVVACDENGAELEALGRRFHDHVVPEVLIDGTAYEFVRVTAPGVALYRRRLSEDNRTGPSQAPPPRKPLRRRTALRVAANSVSRSGS
jgi:hypothetical protein